MDSLPTTPLTEPDKPELAEVPDSDVDYYPEVDTSSDIDTEDGLEAVETTAATEGANEAAVRRSLHKFL